MLRTGDFCLPIGREKCDAMLCSPGGGRDVNAMNTSCTVLSSAKVMEIKASGFSHGLLIVSGIGCSSLDDEPVELPTTTTRHLKTIIALCLISVFCCAASVCICTLRYFPPRSFVAESVQVSAARDLELQPSFSTSAGSGIDVHGPFFDMHQ